MAKKRSSKDRVRLAGTTLELDIEVVTMPESTHTAEDAAKACGCSVGQIVKSLVFEGARSHRILLLLVAGNHRVDLERVAEMIGEPLKRADARRVRDETGFAIGGVAPIGHLSPMPTWIDEDLLRHETVWAAGGAPNAVFRVDPNKLANAIRANVVRFD